MTEGSTPARSAKEQFDRQAAHYNAQWNTWTEESLNWLLAHADCQPTDRTLDVATGTGFTALAFAPCVRSVIGLDVSSGMLAQARRNAEERGLSNVTFQEGDAENLPFSDAAFDLVTCRVAPHHFLSVPRFLDEVARVLKAGGRFLLADTSVPDDEAEVAAWQNETEVLRDPSHVRNYSPEEWRRFVSDAGLRVELLSDSDGNVPMTLSDWLVKAGCTPERTATVRQRFESAPVAITHAFQIERRPDGDIGFAWQRVVLKAVKP